MPTATASVFWMNTVVVRTGHYTLRIRPELSLCSTISMTHFFAFVFSIRIHHSAIYCLGDDGKGDCDDDDHDNIGAFGILLLFWLTLLHYVGHGQPEYIYFFSLWNTSESEWSRSISGSGLVARRTGSIQGINIFHKLGYLLLNRCAWCHYGLLTSSQQNLVRRNTYNLSITH